MSKRILTVIIIAVLLCMTVSCGRISSETPDPVQINPESDAAKAEIMTAALYYGNADYKYLIPESREIKVAANDPLAVSVLDELFKGPKAESGEYNLLVNPDTKVVKASGTGNVLTVTLSSHFLEWPTTVVTAEQRELAVYSVVNTAVEATGYSQIQLMVDRDDNGVGQRIRREDLGFFVEDAEGFSGTLGVMERSGAIVLTPHNTVRCIFDAMMKKDYAYVYSFIAYNDSYGSTKKDETSFRAQIETAMPTLEGYTIREIIISDDGQSAVAMIDYTLRFGTNDALTRTNVPNYLIKENGVWKQRYSAFEQIFLKMEVSGS